MRAVLYARYSSDLQSPASINDQNRALRDALPRLGLREIGAFSDAAISGSSLARPGLEAALAEIEAGRADVLIAEALDRISRDLEHVARIAKRIAFRGARIVTLSEGEIGALHIGLSGTMAQLYLEQLAEKTRRGLRGVVADGRIAAGRAYGYRPTAERGRFEIVAEEAEIVRRIMREYAAGISPRAIAKTLNMEGVPGPRGGTWKGNTILGDRALGVGIVNNRIYVGEIVWNRSTWRKNPTTGRRQPFPLPEAQWVVTAAPQLRIVDEALWTAVRQRQGAVVKRGGVKRPTRPLSGLLVCGCCGRKMTIVGTDRYGCPVNKEQGLCENGRTVPAVDAERRVLVGLRTHLCHPDAVEAYARAYVAERKRLRETSAARERELRREARRAAARAGSYRQHHRSGAGGGRRRARRSAGRGRGADRRAEGGDRRAAGRGFGGRPEPLFGGSPDPEPRGTLGAAGRRSRRGRGGALGARGVDLSDQGGAETEARPVCPRDRGRSGRVHGPRPGGRGFLVSTGCGGAQPPILAIGRTPDPQARRLV
ncbi:MAG: recombinase family protein [Amaricoccus sp.]|uniref:recombinase family protein n=1 Tax=Amaricoccus sp. TaxID=1872485 RepID=UPI0039E2FE64